MEISLYDELKAKRKEKVNTNTEQWGHNLLSIVCAMFDWRVPQIKHTEFIELYLNMLGECAIWNTRDGYAVTRCNRAGKPNVNGLGSDLICGTGNGESKTFYDFENSNEVVYIKNDFFAMPDMNVDRVADILGETERSLRKLAINSRYTPVALAHNDLEKTAIEGIFSANDSEKGNVIVSSNIASELLDGIKHDIPVLNITDVSMSDKIQYLHKSKDDTLRQFFNLYGMDTSGAGKLAQQSVEEINAGEHSHHIIPNLRLSVRLEAIEELKEKFGWNDVSVSFSKCWVEEEAKRNTVEDDTEDLPIEDEQEDEEDEKTV